MIVQNESMHPQPIHHHPPRELEEAWLVNITYLVLVLLSVAKALHAQRNRELL